VKRALLVVVAAAFLVAGCGGDDNEATPTETVPVTTPVQMTDVRVYFLRDGKVWPVSRQIDAAEDRAGALAAELAEGPTDQEKEDLKLTSEFPSGPDAKYSHPALAQWVYTMTQFPNEESVKVDGKRYTRADFEDQTPGILVESPLAFEDVTSPIRATGTANTFEATFNYELTDTDGKIVDENFVTATSGTGTRGTFDFTTKTFTVPFSGVGSLVVFERSAEDGSRTKLVEIPLRMSQ
jgi:immunoglobulin-like protein involved in spore germination